MKTLIISLYDGTTNQSAAILDEEGKLTFTEVSNNVFRLFSTMRYLHDSDPSFARLNRFLDKYESVILCEDGYITKIK